MIIHLFINPLELLAGPIIDGPFSFNVSLYIAKPEKNHGKKINNVTMVEHYIFFCHWVCFLGYVYSSNRSCVS